MSRVLNFIWINLDFPPETPPTVFQRPMPPEYLASIQNACALNQGTDVKLWVDAKRMTQAQQDFLRDACASSGIALHDLRDIKAYDTERLYNKPEKSRFWRDDKQSLIWRQVDAAKVLVCLQSNHDQIFFADMDLANTKTDDPKIQKMIKDHGIVVNQGPDYPLIENQLWGFDRARRLGFFEELYKNTLRESYQGENGWMSLVDLVDKKLCASPNNGGEGIYIDHITYSTKESGIRAHHPDHRLAQGLGAVNHTFDPPTQSLTAQFAKFSRKIPAVIAKLPAKLLQRLR